MTKRRSAPPAPPMPPMPAPSAEELARGRRTTEMLREAIVIAKQRNLDRVVILAEMARRHQLPQELEDHFGELGRRYAELVHDRGKKKRPALRVVEGGAA